MTDAYDDAVAHLSRSAKLLGRDLFMRWVRDVWADPVEIFGGCLFDYTGGYVEDGEIVSSSVYVGRQKRWCGCLTQVKEHDSLFGPIEIGHEGGADLLDRVKRDTRIPPHPPGISADGESYPYKVTVESLTAFAEYQRELDELLERPAPVWDEDLRRYVRKNTQ